jgi:PucR C-terminal helix-turn-helix domain
MSHAGSAENDRPGGWEARAGASQPTPLTLVSGAVAGDDLQDVARSAAEALGRPVAIVLPSLGAPVTWPADAPPSSLLDELARHAEHAGADPAELDSPPAGVAHAVPVRIGSKVVGIVAAIEPTAGSEGLGPDVTPGHDVANARAWLEAVAAAAAVTRLMREEYEGRADGAALAAVQALMAGPSEDFASVVRHARRLGTDLAGGAVAICARGSAAEPSRHPEWPAGALVADIGHGRTVAVIPLGTGGAEQTAAAVANSLRADGIDVGVSAPRRQPALVHEALREAMLLSELAASPEAALTGQEETYRLLIGVLLRDPDELELLRVRTISPLLAYDAEHDTELLVTLKTFLARHGSTTETAETMALHRHTVGYRLSRVHEVSGLSPYETDGRERLSLGLKADHILAANERLSKPG